MYWFLHILAGFLRLWPEGWLRCACGLLGRIYFYAATHRRRHLLSHLSHAYPGKDEKEVWRLGRLSCVRTVEMGLLAVVYPRVTGAWVRQRLQISPEDLDLYRQAAEDGPVLVLVPHVCLIEMMTLGREVGFPVENTAVLYRAFRSTGLERFVKEGRTRFGLRPVGRKRGLIEAGHTLKRGGRVVLLFDQSAGRTGELVPFLGRLASTTALPDVFGRNLALEVVFMWIERSAFWRGRLRLERLGRTPGLSSPMEAANRRLEQMLEGDANFAADWLWLHRRWKEGLREKTLFAPPVRPPDLRGDPRATRCVVTLPDGVEEAREILPQLRELRAARPDFQFTLLGGAGVLAALGRAGPPVERRIVLPPGRAGREVLRQEARRHPAVGVYFDGDKDGARRLAALGVLVCVKKTRLALPPD